MPFRLNPSRNPLVQSVFARLRADERKTKKAEKEPEAAAPVPAAKKAAKRKPAAKKQPTKRKGKAK